MKKAFSLTLAECCTLVLLGACIERYTIHRVISISLIVFAAVVVYLLYSTFRKDVKFGIIKSVTFTGFLFGFHFAPFLIQKVGDSRLGMLLGIVVALILSFLNINMKKNS